MSKSTKNKSGKRLKRTISDSNSYSRTRAVLENKEDNFNRCRGGGGGVIENIVSVQRETICLLMKPPIAMERSGATSIVTPSSGMLKCILCPGQAGVIVLLVITDPLIAYLTPAATTIRPSLDNC